MTTMAAKGAKPTSRLRAGCPGQWSRPHSWGARLRPSGCDARGRHHRGGRRLDRGGRLGRGGRACRRGAGRLGRGGRGQDRQETVVASPRGRGGHVGDDRPIPRGRPGRNGDEEVERQGVHGPGVGTADGWERCRTGAAGAESPGAADEDRGTNLRPVDEREQPDRVVVGTPGRIVTRAVAVPGGVSSAGVSVRVMKVPWAAPSPLVSAKAPTTAVTPRPQGASSAGRFSWWPPVRRIGIGSER